MFHHERQKGEQHSDAERAAELHDMVLNLSKCVSSLTVYHSDSMIVSVMINSAHLGRNYTTPSSHYIK